MLVRRLSVAIRSRCRYSTQQPREMKSFTVYVEQNERHRRNTLLGPSKDYPLPGNVTCEALNSTELKESTQPSNPEPKPMYYTLNLKQVANFLTSPAIKYNGYHPANKVKEICSWNVKIDLVAIDCPSLLKKDLVRLFPDADIRARRLTLINFYEDLATSESNDSTEISEKADSFVLAANAVCRTLRSYGYWSDFIDPSSGASRLNTDSYKRLLNQNSKFGVSGFNVNEDSDCKIVSSVSLQDRPFVGSIFTDAPIQSKAVQDVIIGA
ncbi:hypothetical protein M3Y94_00323600 [Aphelenchoides besseyi]|nr:hypothetical protein M3Y94_00323600 [Aphelenchoides besseyi]KAI6235614.1 Methylmalonic aciduria and homocystinuria type D-like protein, mitochondrial [Aphelenchoides besseyi]